MDVEVEDPTTSAKKAKRINKYRKEWENTFTWLKQDNEKARCNLCKKSFLFMHGGLGDIKRHAEGAEHKKHEVVVKQNKTLQSFLGREVVNSQQEKILAAEVTNVYHTVKHAHSYNSLDCTMQLASVMYYDSQIATNTHLGRTKASLIAFNVLGPMSIESTLCELSKGVFFGISTDASNHGSAKLFPILLRYYIPSKGVKLFLLDFFEDPDETANAIYANLKNRIEQAGLSLNNMSCYSADNASVNFGRFHSVYQLFYKENNTVLAVGCPAHMVNNSIKNALTKCCFDVETLILKTFSHFSSQAKRCKELKDFFNYVDLEYKTILRHVPTRWLSLFPAIERLLNIFPAVKSYFLSQEEIPIALQVFFSEDDFIVQKTECYLGFFHNTLKFLFDTEQKLEKADLLCFEVFNILKYLKEKISQRINDNFFGFLATNILKTFSPCEQNKIKESFLEFYKNIAKYLDSKYDFSENNLFSKLNIFSLKSPFDFDSIVEIVTNLSIDINIDNLYEEYCILKPTLDKACALPEESIIQKWNKIFLGNPEIHYFLKIIQFVFSIYGSNADSERIFSLCNAAWSDSRNKLLVDHVKAELQIKTNFNLTCQEFYNMAVKNKKLLEAVRSNKKYSVS